MRVCAHADGHARIGTASAGGRAVCTSLAAPSMRRATRAASRRCGYCPSPCTYLRIGRACAGVFVQMSAPEDALRECGQGPSAHIQISAVNAESDADNVPKMALLLNTLRRRRTHGTHAHRHARARASCDRIYNRSSRRCLSPCDTVAHGTRAWKHARARTL